MKWTVEKEQWLIDNAESYQGRTELTIAFDELFDEALTVNAIRRKLNRLGLTNDKTIHWTDEQNRWLIEHVNDESYTDLTVRFNDIFKTNVSSASLCAHCYRDLGIEKPNKGCNMYHDTSIFKPGEITKHTGRLRVKMEDGSYKPYARYIVEKSIGRSLKEDEIVIYLDGNRENVDLSNLRVVTRSEAVLISRNDWHGKGAITESAIEYAKLKIAIRDAKKGVTK